jgi:glycosyltransferase involved in cell wall biosynthesis
MAVDDGSLSAMPGLAPRPTMRNGFPESLAAAAEELSSNDVVIIQHEFGIFGGPDGDELLDVMGAITVPMIVVLHTVLEHPTAHQAQVLMEICSRANRLVVMTESARSRLLSTYPIDESSVSMIPHGALLASNLGMRPEKRAHDRTRLLSWGLLGPGKGIENVIEAIAALNRRGHPVEYVIAGMTHPKVIAWQGDIYRTSLVEQARAAGVAHLVSFDRTYRGPAELTRYISTFSLVVMSYQSTDQVVSGVLVDSIAAGRPVIATAFPHAVELLSAGAGIVVAHGDRAALVDAIALASGSPAVLAEMSKRAAALAPAHSWSTVGSSYVEECLALAGATKPVAA